MCGGRGGGGEGGRVKGRVFELTNSTNSNREERDSANRLLLPLFAAEHFQLRAHTHTGCVSKNTQHFKLLKKRTVCCPYC